MGSQLSPVLANIYMEYFKEMALGSTSLKLFMWLRYVYVTFILWPHQEDIQTLLGHANTVQPSIQFTMEKEQGNKLSFLDLLITCTEQEFRSCQPSFRFLQKSELDNDGCRVNHAEERPILPTVPG